MDSMPLKNIQPFNPTIFFEHILIPHTATLLIAHDLDLSMKEAYKVMIKSGDFGYFHFPAEDDDEVIGTIIRGHRTLNLDKD